MGRVTVAFVGAFLAQVLLMLLFSIFRKTEWYAVLLDYLLMSPHLAWKRPWTLFTYPFIYPIHNSGNGLLTFLIDALFLWSFGMQFAQLLGEAKLKRALLFSVPLFGTLLMLVGLLIGQAYPVGSASATIIFLIFSVSAFVPNMPIMLFGIIPLRLIIFALLALVIELLNHGLVSAMGITLLVAASLGYLYALELKRGEDWLENFEEALTSRWQRLRKPAKTAVKTSKPADVIPLHRQVTQEEIDKILDKISEKGYSSLSKEEKDKLEQFAGKRKSDN